METIIFLLFAGLALASALVVVAHRNPVYSTMSLVVTLISIAALFLLLGAPFLAALQVLIYTGAILVLFLFVIMLLNVTGQGAPEGEARSFQRWTAVAAAVLFAGLLLVPTWRESGTAEVGPLTEEFVALKPLAAFLFDRWLLGFELVGLLLLVAVIAATVLARKPPPLPPEALAERARMRATPASGYGSRQEEPLPGEAPEEDEELEAERERPAARARETEEAERSGDGDERPDRPDRLAAGGTLRPREVE